MKSSNIGGQAVLEGIMMKHNEEYAVAVRKPDGEISVKKEKYHSIVKWKVLTTTPFIRGVFNFIDSMVIGIKTLTYSASFYEEEEEHMIGVWKKWKKMEEGKKGKIADGRDSGVLGCCGSGNLHGTSVFSDLFPERTDSVLSGAYSH